MSYFQAIILGIIQGQTEFLPISSSGHLALMQKVMDLPGDATMEFFDVAVHLGTLAAIALVLCRRVGRLVVGSFKLAWWAVTLGRPGPLSNDNDRKLALFVLVATLPTMVIGLGFKKLTLGDVSVYNSAKASLLWLGVAFALTGGWLWFTNRRNPGPCRLPELTVWDALLLGVAQGAAVAPGISRSGSTIGLLLLRRTERDTAGELAFVVAVPAIVGAFILNLHEVFFTETAHAIDASALTGPAIIGGLTSFMVGLVSLLVLLAVVRRGRLHGFAWYVWALALVCLVVGAIGRFAA